MSYGFSAALQKGVYDVLSTDASLSLIIGTHVYDAAPSGALPDLFVSLGTEKVEARSDTSGDAAMHRFTVTVFAQDQGGFARAKQAAVAVSDALDGSVPALDRGRVVYLNFERADARRVSAGGRRRIDLRFVALVEDN